MCDTNGERSTCRAMYRACSDHHSLTPQAMPVDSTALSCSTQQYMHAVYWCQQLASCCWSVHDGTLCTYSPWHMTKNNTSMACTFLTLLLSNVLLCVCCWWQRIHAVSWQPDFKNAWHQTTSSRNASSSDIMMMCPLSPALNHHHPLLSPMLHFGSM